MKKSTITNIAKILVVTSLVGTFTTLDFQPNTVSAAQSSSTKEKITYYYKQIDKLKAQYDQLENTKYKYAKSSQKYQDIITKQIKNLNQQKYYYIKIQEVAQKAIKKK